MSYRATEPTAWIGSNELARRLPSGFIAPFHPEVLNVIRAPCIMAVSVWRRKRVRDCAGLRFTIERLLLADSVLPSRR